MVEEKQKQKQQQPTHQVCCEIKWENKTKEIIIHNEI